MKQRYAYTVFCLIGVFLLIAGCASEKESAAPAPKDETQLKQIQQEEKRQESAGKT